MKGASRIVSEVLLFAIGIAITLFVIVQFNAVENNIGEQSFYSQLSEVSNSVMNAIKDAGSAESAYIKLEMPPKLSDKDYVITLVNDPKKLLVVSMAGDQSRNFVREIFNIEPGYSVSGSVASGSRFVAVVKSGSDKTIRLQRR